MVGYRRRIPGHVKAWAFDSSTLRQSWKEPDRRAGARWKRVGSVENRVVNVARLPPQRDEEPPKRLLISGSHRP